MHDMAYVPCIIELMLYLIKSSPSLTSRVELPDRSVLSRERLADRGAREGYPIPLTSDMRPHPLLSGYFHYLRFLDRKTVWQYAYEIRGFAEFLEGKGSSLMGADQADLSEYKKECLENRVKPLSRSTWRQIESALLGLFRWMKEEGLRETVPIRKSPRGKSGVTSRQMKIRHLTYEQWSTFILLGVRGKTPTGATSSNFSGTSTRRMRTGCEIALATGMRLQEFSTLLIPELGAAADGQKFTFVIEKCAKYEKPRPIYLGALARNGADAYLRGERVTTVQTSARTLERQADKLYVVDFVDVEAQVVSGVYDGVRRKDEIRLLKPDLRRQMVREGDYGLESMALFVTRTGKMASPSTWQKSFAQASARYRSWTDPNPDLIMPNKVRPHDLRHTFAVTMLEFLDRAEGEEDTRGSLRTLRRFKSVRKLQAMMGHADPATTMQYAAYRENLAQPVEDAWQGWENPNLDFHDYWAFLRNQD